MPSPSLSSFTFLLITFFSYASDVFSRQDVTAAVVGLRIQRSKLTGKAPIQRREGINVALDNEGTSYSANISLGTPAQDLRVRVDTGSSDLWVNTPSSRICSLRNSPCSDSGTYDANSSSTYEFVSDAFTVSYADGSGASGDYATDNMEIGATNLDNFQFGIGYESGSPDAILGIGYPANEAQVNSNAQRPYSNLPQALVDANLIKSNAYSLWLDDLQSATGSILFGGVDTDKYVGSLQTLPVEKIRGQYVQFAVTISRMAISQGGNSRSLTTGLPTGVILDSGSTISYLPNNLVSDIYDAFDVRYSRRQGSGFCSCDLANQDMTVDFAFTSPTISVPIRELVINPEQDTFQKREAHSKRQGFGRADDANICLFGIAPSSGSLSILGDTFLRSAYVVYDLANNEISLAQTNFNSTTSNLREIGTGPDSVPDATSVSNVVQASITAGGGGRIGNPTATATDGNDPVSGSFGHGSLLSIHFMMSGIVAGTGFYFYTCL